jgi:hypothetical protein
MIANTCGSRLLTAARSKSTARRFGGAPLGMDSENPVAGLLNNSTLVFIES